jgi:hypothetical protein
LFYFLYLWDYIIDFYEASVVLHNRFKRYIFNIDIFTEKSEYFFLVPTKETPPPTPRTARGEGAKIYDKCET